MTGPPAPRIASAPSTRAFLELGFRPLYLAGSAWAAVSLWLWVFAPGWLTGRMPGVWWHAHEMLWGVVATIAVGFLLTAAATWTGVNPLRGRGLAVLCLAWLIARAGFLIPGAAAFVVAGTAQVLFFAGAAAALARAIHGTRNRRNAALPWLVAALGAADAAYLRSIWLGEWADLLRHFGTGLLLMALVTLLVARRVIPFFSMRRLPGLSLPMHTRSGQVQLGIGGLAVVAGLADQSTVLAFALALTGAIALWQWLAWKPWAVRGVPLLWVLYVGYAGLALGLLVAAAHAAGWIARAAWSVHVIGVAGFGVLIIGMITRTALGHLGRPLQTDRLMVTAYALVIAAALLRLLALIPGFWSMGALHASASAWVLAFVLYLWRFVPWLIRPRADAQADPAAPPRQ